jgi:hypothetical protein
MAFLKNIEAPEEIGTVFHHMTADVYNETQGKQLPELSLSYVGDFYLKDRPKSEAGTQVAAVAPASITDQSVRQRSYCRIAVVPIGATAIGCGGMRAQAEGRVQGMREVPRDDRGSSGQLHDGIAEYRARTRRRSRYH